jgi:hypothetical protein
MTVCGIEQKGNLTGNPMSLKFEENLPSTFTVTFEMVDQTFADSRQFSKVGEPIKDSTINLANGGEFAEICHFRMIDRIGSTTIN